MADTMHIVYCGDADYVPMMGISMTSVVWNNLDSKIVFHLLVEDLKQRDAARLQSFAKLYRNVAGIQVHRIDQESEEVRVFRALKAGYPIGTNYRLLLPKLLGDEVERVLYLDGDVACRGDIRAFWQLEMGDNLAAGVPDPLEPMHLKRTGLTSYINAGILLMNLKGWRQEHILEKVLDFYREADYLGYPDQDAVNILCKGRILTLPQNWNYPVSCNFTVKGRRNDIVPEAVLCHFLGPVTKPWDCTCLDPRAALWRGYRDSSFWRGMPLRGDRKLLLEMRAIERMFEDGETDTAFSRYVLLLKKLGCRFKPIVIRQQGWK